jgi:Na+-transporting methylmalonyl-CoA/oxaloacetate decarboxylase gamma subunit
MTKPRFRRDADQEGAVEARRRMTVSMTAVVMLVVVILVIVMRVVGHGRSSPSSHTVHNCLTA